MCIRDRFLVRHHCSSGRCPRKTIRPRNTVATAGYLSVVASLLVDVIPVLNTCRDVGSTTPVADGAFTDPDVWASAPICLRIRSRCSDDIVGLLQGHQSSFLATPTCVCCGVLA